MSSPDHRLVFRTSTFATTRWTLVWEAAQGGDIGAERMHTPLNRLQQTHSGHFPDGQLRTLRRRLADWRLAAAHRLVFRDLHPQPA